MRFAILEDSRSEALLLKTMVEKLDHEGVIFPTAKSFREGLEASSFDLLLMDWILPDGSGDELLIWVRERFGWKLPVIFVTGRVEEADVAEMLLLGADDYVCKPIRYLELAARIEALLRRRGFLIAAEGKNFSLQVGNIELQPEARLARLNGGPVSLTAKEFDLAVLLLQNLGTLFSRQSLLERVWGGELSAFDTRTVDTHMSRVRRKLELDEEHGWTLTAVYGHGYRLEHAQGNPAQ